MGDSIQNQTPAERHLHVVSGKVLSDSVSDRGTENGSPGQSACRHKSPYSISFSARKACDCVCFAATNREARDAALAWLVEVRDEAQRLIDEIMGMDVTGS